MNKYCYKMLLITILTSIMHINVAAAEDLKTFLLNKFAAQNQNAVVLIINSPNCAVKGKETVIDPNSLAVTPFIKNGRTMVPLRFFGEQFGFDVSWEGTQNKAILKKGGETFEIRNGETYIYHNGNQVKIDAPAELINGRFFLPLTAVTNSMGLNSVYSNGFVVVGEGAINIKTGIENELMFAEDKSGFPVMGYLKTISPSGEFCLETIGSGQTMPEKIQIINTQTQKVMWEDEAYLDSSAIWSPDEKNVVVSRSARRNEYSFIINLETFDITDAPTEKELNTLIPTKTSVNQYGGITIRPLEWLSNEQILFSFNWGSNLEETGDEEIRYDGRFKWNINTNYIEIVQFAGF